MATPQRIQYHGQTYVRLKTAASAEQAARAYYDLHVKQRAEGRSKTFDQIARKYGERIADSLRLQVLQQDLKDSYGYAAMSSSAAMAVAEHRSKLQQEIAALEKKLAQKTAATIGPRGGKIIGKTRSGKPIYAPSHEHLHSIHRKRWQKQRGSGYVTPRPKIAKRDAEQYAQGFTKEDHLDAAELHAQQASRAFRTAIRTERKGRADLASGAYLRSSAHRGLADYHGRMARKDEPRSHHKHKSWYPFRGYE